MVFSRCSSSQSLYHSNCSLATAGSRESINLHIDHGVKDTEEKKKDKGSSVLFRVGSFTKSLEMRGSVDSSLVKNKSKEDVRRTNSSDEARHRKVSDPGAFAKRLQFLEQRNSIISSEVSIFR